MNKRCWNWLSILLFVVLIAGCGGGGGNGGTTTPPSASLSGTLSGTAATGAPIASATLTLKDKNGTTKTVNTGTDGKYTLDVTGMTAPLLLKITAAGKTFYSVATTTGTVNIHPYTDLIIRNWYKVQGSDVDTVFGGTGVLPSAPTATEINTIEAVIRQLLTQLLMSVGIDSSQFNLISTAFDANNTGFDNVLKRTQVTINTTSGQVTITMVDPSTGTTGGTILSTPINIDFSTTANPLDAAKTAINTMMTNFKNTIDAKQCALVAADIQPYLVADYLDEGYDAAALATTMKDMLGCSGAPTTVTEWSIPTVVSYDDANKKLTGTFKLTVANGGNFSGDMEFKNVNGSWLGSGDQEIAEMYVSSSVANNLRATSAQPSGYVNSLNVRVYDYLNKTQSVTVNGPGVSNMSIPMSCSSATATCEHNSYKKFQATINMTPTVGSVYTVMVTKTDTSTVTYTRTLIMTPGVTQAATDFPMFSGLTTHSISGIPGTTITAQVYLPLWITEIVPPRVHLSNGNTFLGDVNASWVGTPARGQNNSFSVAIPAAVNSQAVTAAVLQQDAGAWSIKGWGETKVLWYLE